MHYAQVNPAHCRFRRSNLALSLDRLGGFQPFQKRHPIFPLQPVAEFDFDPPMVMFAANQLSSERKHTVVNAEETGWFVWNMATYDLREAVNISAMEVPEGEDEFQHAGVTASLAFPHLDLVFLKVLRILNVAIFPLIVCGATQPGWSKSSMEK